MKKNKQRLANGIEIVRQPDRVDDDLLLYVEHALRDLTSQLSLDAPDLMTVESSEVSLAQLNLKLEQLGRQKKLLSSLRKLLEAKQAGQG